MTTPAADKTSEDQGRQDRQGKKDKPGVDRPPLERVHGLGGLNRGNGLARDPPLDDVGDHQQIQENERGRRASGWFLICECRSADAELFAPCAESMPDLALLDLHNRFSQISLMCPRRNLNAF